VSQQQQPQPSQVRPERRRAEPQSFRARTMSVSLTASDVHESLAWYRDIVGFTVAEEYERNGRLVGASLKAGVVSIMLSQDDGAQGEGRVKGQGFSMYFTTAQDVDMLAEEIEARGGTLEMRPTDMPWGARLFRIADPDGFRISISSEPTTT